MIGPLPKCDACGREHRISTTVEPSKHRKSEKALTLCVPCWIDPDSLLRIERAS